MVTSAVTEASPLSRRPAPVVAGTVIWLASEVMFFGGLFGAYFSLRAAAPAWPPPGSVLEIPRAALFTAVLLASSATFQLAVRAAAGGRAAPFRRWTVVTLVLGAAFLANQAGEWANLPFGVATSAYGSAFYLMTGFHGLHVLGGLLAMAVLLGRAGTEPPEDRDGAEAVALYWHFVDAVWLAVFATLFLLR